jgi:hypothetical protein
VYVLTIDQRGSRRRADRVPELLAALAAASGVHPVLTAERTVGDEVQLVVADGASVVDVVETVSRLGGWTVGVGVGPVDAPMPLSTREGRGRAFSAARDAVDRAKRSPARLAVSGGTDPYAARRAESSLWLLLAVQDRRTERGWEVVDTVRARGSQAAAADALGVSAQAVSQVLQAARWSETERGRELAAWLLEEL